MDKQKMRRSILILVAISLVIYGLQILIFRDPRNTAFYIFQDFAFMPMTIAIATLVVGDLMDSQEKKERMDKTRMLTSTFYTEIGTKLTRAMIPSAEPKEQLKTILTMQCASDADLKEQQEYIRTMPLEVHLTKETYTSVMEMILGARTALLVLSSNPLLFEHETFTDLLWAIFHLLDEYHLRGDYDDLTPTDIRHLNEDFEEMLRLLLMSYIANVKYLRETYPNLYSRAKEKLQALVKRD